MHVDAVEERAGDLRLIFLGTFRCPAAAERGIIQMPAAAGIHGGHQLESRGICHMGVDPGDHGPAAFHRLAQRLQRGAGEFRKFVEEQHPAMGERDLARLRAQAAADERGQRGRLMGIAERAVAHQPPVRKLPRHGMDHGDFERRRGLEREKQSRQALGQHGFAGPGRAHHQKVMAAGRRHFERALGALLALDIGEVEVAFGESLHLGYRPRQALAALEVVDQCDDGGGRQHREIAGPGCLAALGGRADEAAACGRRRDCSWQNTCHRVDPPVEPEFAQDGIVGKVVTLDHAHGRQHAQRDGQIEMAAFLQEIGRRQVDGDALGRQGQSDGDEGRAHALAAFAHRLVGQSHHGEGG